MSEIIQIAAQFIKACDTGQGWNGCRDFCVPDAAFEAQAEPLVAIRSLRGYTDWMRDLLTVMPDGRYELRSFAVDEQRRNVCAYGIFYATHTGQGGPLPPTGRSTTSDYVYVMQFERDLISNMTKVWNAPWSMKELGWA